MDSSDARLNIPRHDSGTNANNDAAGAPYPLTLGDKLYLMGPGTMSDMVAWRNEARRVLLSKQVNPLAEVAKQLNEIPREHRDAFIDAAIRAQGGTDKIEPAPAQIHNAMLTELDCVRFAVTLLVRKNHPEVQFGQFDADINESTYSDFFQPLSECFPGDPLGTSKRGLKTSTTKTGPLSIAS